MDQSAPEQANVPEKDPKQNKTDEWRTRIEACKTYRRKLIATWTVNIDYRRGKPFPSQTDEDRVNVNLDWNLTKAKQSYLFSQVPQVRVNHPPQTTQAGPWLHAFEQKLNDTLVMAGIESSMDEVLADVINAAGIGGVIVSHEAIMEDKEVPTLDMSVFPPEIAQQIQKTGKMPDGSPIPMTVVPQVVDHRYLVSRISPSDLLWPITFTGSDFDNAPWIGRSGRVTWAQAVQMFKLTEEDRSKVVGENRTSFDRLSNDTDRDKTQSDEMVGFDEIFYKDYYFDSSAKSYNTIHRLVFLHGKDEPVINEAWTGQTVGAEASQIVGATRFPIRLCTLTYITDETIPPSDSAVGRPQVNEIMKARTQIMLQRERSLPVRWFDVNRIDSIIQQSLMRGTWQGFIPVQGSGERAIGEVARPNYPQDNYNFDNIAKSDLTEIWGVGPNQAGSFGQGRQSASEANIVQTNFDSRKARERAKVAKFFTTISEVLGGLLCLFEDPTTFGQGFDKGISRALTYSILADSTVLLDSDQRRERLKDFINFTAKSGWLNIEPVLKEYATLSGLDPNLVIQKPQPKPPVEPTISLRMTGVEDVMNPIMLAFLMKSGQAPDEALIEQAKQRIAQAQQPPAPPQPPQQPQGGPQGPPGGPQAGPQGPPQGPPPPGTTPEPPAPAIGEAHPNWAALDRINKRVMDQE